MGKISNNINIDIGDQVLRVVQKKLLQFSDVIRHGLVLGWMEIATAMRG